MKITVIKKAETKKSSPISACPWVVEDMAPTKR